MDVISLQWDLIRMVSLCGPAEPQENLISKSRLALAVLFAGGFLNAA